MGYKINYLGHVNIGVRNVERAHQWYKTILGLHTQDYMPGRAAFLSADLNQSHEVALFEVGEEAASPEKGQIGLSHMAWRLSSLEDLQDFYHHLAAHQVPIDHVSDHGLSLGIYFHDPDGNGIEVYYELPREQWPRLDHVFSGEGRKRGLFPGPWDELVDASRTSRSVAATA